MYFSQSSEIRCAWVSNSGCMAKNSFLSIHREEAARDEANSARTPERADRFYLCRVVLAVEVVDRADLSRRGFPYSGIADIPAAAIVAYDDLRAPRLTF